MSYIFINDRRGMAITVQVADEDTDIGSLLDAFEMFLRASEFHADTIRKALGFPRNTANADALANLDKDYGQLLADHNRLEAAIKWALGEGDSNFGENMPPSGTPRFWWRKELRERAFAPPVGERP